MQLCVPGASLCAGIDERLVCDDTGLGYTTFPCADGESCIEGSCVEHTCAPGTAGCVNDSTRELCDASGLGATTEACGATETCVAGACVPHRCSPGETSCAGTFTRLTCDADGLGYTREECPTGRSCDAGTCVERVCVPGSVDCADDSTRRVCDSSGLGYQMQGCSAEESCTAGACVPWLCSPGSSLCLDDQTAASCRANGLGYDETACPSGQFCEAGACQSPCWAELAADDFEDHAVGTRPSPWIDGCMASSDYDWSVSDVAHGGSRALEMSFVGSGPEAAVGIPVTWPSSGTVRVSFWMRPETTSHNIYTLPVRLDDRLVNAVPFQSTGELVRKETDVFYQAGVWHHVRIEMDFDTSTYRTSIDGTTYETDALISAVVPCTLSADGYFSFHGGYFDQKWHAYLDDLSVVHYPPGCPLP
jgi:hypothetical protein